MITGKHLALAVFPAYFSDSRILLRSLVGLRPEGIDPYSTPPHPALNSPVLGLSGFTIMLG